MFVTSSYKDFICWDYTTWEQVFVIKGPVTMLHGARKQLMGIKVGQNLRFWSKKIIADYNEDFYIGEDEEIDTSVKAKSDDVQVKGPMRFLFPLILKSMME
jgi:hypothetical protein